MITSVKICAFFHFLPIFFLVLKEIPAADFNAINSSVKNAKNGIKNRPS